MASFSGAVGLGLVRFACVAGLGSKQERYAATSACTTQNSKLEHSLQSKGSRCKL